MKKIALQIAALMLAAVMVFGMSGCKGGKDTGKKGTNSDNPFGLRDDVDLDGYEFILASHWISDYEQERGKSEVGDMYLDLFDELESRYNCKITLKSYPDKSTIVDDVSRSVLAGEKPFDVLDLPFNLFQNLITKDVLYIQNDIKEIDFESENFNRALTDMMTFKGHVYGSWYGPFDNITGIFYNKTLLEREKQPDPYELYKNNEWNWANFSKIAKAVTKELADGTQQYGIAGSTVLEKGILFSNGGSIVQDNGNGSYEFGLVKPQSIEAVEYMRTLTTKDKVVCPQRTFGIVDDVFQNGEAAFLADVFWGAAKYFGKGIEDEYGFLPFPSGNNGEKPNGVITDARGFVMPKTLTDPEKTGIIYNELIKMAEYRMKEVDTRYLNLDLDQESIDIYKGMFETAKPDLSEGVGSLTDAVVALEETSRKAEKDPAAQFSSIASKISVAINDHFGKIK